MKKFFTLFLLVTVTFISNAQTNCDPVTITNVEHEGAGNRITWTPHTSETVISQGTENCGRYTSDMNVSLGVYHRFTPEHLETVKNGILTDIMFAPWFASSQPYIGYTYTIQVYKGGRWGATAERDQGTLIAYKELNNDDLHFREYNTIPLETPIPIDASQELWIGYYCTNIDPDPVGIAKFPTGADFGPRNEGFGNLFFAVNKWFTLYEFDDYFDCNWCIKGKVQMPDGATVNIFANGNPIASNISGTTYLHTESAEEKQCYTVAVNCVEGGTSPLSNESCIDGGAGIRDNEQIRNFTIYPNPAQNSLTLTRAAAQKARVEIYNFMGTTVASFEMNDSKTEINISSFSSGVYFIKLTDDQNFAIQRFIKQ